MRTPPNYFERVRQKAEQRWIQLENDPELAGPWHQLFKQVQSPRHVLSELLQNADDAGATEASVEIADGCLIFEHNGEDFTDEQFTSLCRFGFSNKRSLHTIGFRGIGFKSTFSLGNTVELYTPSLAVDFNKTRFTQPRWLSTGPETQNRTRVQVSIIDPNRKRELEKNLEEWKLSALSLLFFRNIRRLRIGDKDLRWTKIDEGPVPTSEWMSLDDAPGNNFLLVQSEEEAFPDEALEEIRQERLLSEDQEASFPPCKVELVLGAIGRLYVVLPTGVKTKLPFACNAPFIQDPARLKIKDPETSPTNRWLLDRVGKLAGEVMLKWLSNSEKGNEYRAQAYNLMPDVDRDDNSLDGVCSATVEISFDEVVTGKPILLTEPGELVEKSESVILPHELSDIWSAEEAAKFFDEKNRKPLAATVTAPNKQKLKNWNLVDEIDQDKIIKILSQKHLPKPSTWSKLLKLWSYLSGKFNSYYTYGWDKRDVRIIPVQGSEVMYAAREVVRLGDKRLLKSDTDWEFLSEFLLVMNPNWTRYLGEKRREAKEQQDKELIGEVEPAHAVLTKLQMDSASDLDTVMETVAASLFNKKSVPLSDCVRFAQIAAALNAKAGNSFRFASADLKLHSGYLIIDPDGLIEDLFPESWREKNFLHEDYNKNFTSCTDKEWEEWINSGKSNLLKFAPIQKKNIRLWNRPALLKELQDRGSNETPSYRFVTSDFRIEDWDFDEKLWSYWESLAKENPNIWGQIGEFIVNQPSSFWSYVLNAQVHHISTTGSSQNITREALLPSWIKRLRELPCLPDTHGIYRTPREMMLRKPETEAFRDVEPFIKAQLDSERTRNLLKLLGVRDIPTGPDQLLERLRALAKLGKPPVQEVEKWYGRLDQVLDSCTTQDFEMVKKAFQEEHIIFTESGIWEKASGVFQIPDEMDAPGAEVIRSSIQELSLWRRIGVAERPTADLAIKWLKEIPSGKPLSKDETRRVKTLLGRYRNTIWEECGHWLNLADEWVSVEMLKYSVSMQSLVKYAHLDVWVKQKTADFQSLPAEAVASPPFNKFVPLAEKIENRPDSSLKTSKGVERKNWLNRLGKELQRIKLEDESESTRVRKLGFELANTVWQTVSGLEVIPYIDGTPAGLPTATDVLWRERTLYVENKGVAKLARAVSQELSGKFRLAELADAVKLCFDRSEDFVIEYLEENFELLDPESGDDVIENESAEASDANKAEGDSQEEESAGDREEDWDDDEPYADDEDESDDEFEDDSDDFEDEDREERERKRKPKRELPAKPTLIERFALSQGFRKDGGDRFFHPDGSWIAKTGDSSGFQWEHRSRNGGLVRYYWLKEHCLVSAPLEVEAPVWFLMRDYPDLYALILTNRSGEPEEYTGRNIQKMTSDQKIRLFPATYRLQYLD